LDDRVITVTRDPLPVYGRYSSGAFVTVTANVASGYPFASWGGDIIGSASPMTVTMNDIKGVIAYIGIAKAYF
jgi:hypothetical protein